MFESTPEFNSPIRVGFVMHKMQVAGAEILVKQIIERLAGAIEPTVICLDGIGQLGEQLLDAGTPVITLDRKPGLDWTVARRLAAELQARKIEVVHAHQYTPFFYSAIARARYGAKVKLMFTEHGRHYPDVVSWKRRLINRVLLRRFADVTTACCDFSTLALRTLDGFPAAFTLRNGVDVSQLPVRGNSSDVKERRGRLGLKPDILYAACVARMHSIKDHATLIRAWKIVARHSATAQLLLIGDGEERASIENQVAMAGLENRVQFWGIRNDVAAILRAVDVFSLTSVSEAASLTLLEAMASGCASVVTDVGGNAEHLRDYKDGFLVPRSDDALLAERLIELLASPSLRSEFGSNARLRVEEHFSLDKAVESYASHYRMLAKRAGPDTANAGRFLDFSPSIYSRNQTVSSRKTKPVAGCK